MSSGLVMNRARISSASDDLSSIETQRTRKHWMWTLFRNQFAVLGLVIVAIFILIALLAPLLTPYEPLRIDVMNKLLSPSGDHLMGTDQFGRDVATRMVYGARLSMGVGLSVGVLSMLVGSILGLLAGYYSKLDSIIMRFADALMAFPSLIFAIVLMGILGPSIQNIIVALTIVFGPRVARVARGSVLICRGDVYVQAAQATGLSDGRILFRHILPNIVSPLITQGSYIFALAILAEASLSFIGVGASPDIPSWGNMLSEGQIVMRQAWWISIFPGMAIVAVVFGANLFGDGLRDALDPRLRGD